MVKWSPGRSMFVVDPKTLAIRYLVRPGTAAASDVFTQTNSRLVRLFAWLRKASERWFTQVFLLIALIIYACIGGAIFSTIEGNHEAHLNSLIRQLHQPIEVEIDRIVDGLWVYRNNFPMPGLDPVINKKTEPEIDFDWYRQVLFELDQFDLLVQRQCDKRHNYSLPSFSETNHWTFMGSVFFSMTVFTTIGYGNNPPKTMTGKTATMIYSFFGIPLLLMVLASYGKIFTKFVKFLILSVRRLYYMQSLRSVRHISRRATRMGRIQDSVLNAMNRLQPQPPFYVDRKTGRVSMLPPPVISAPIQLSEQQSMFRRPSRNTVVSPSFSLDPMTPMPPELLNDDDLDDEFNLPVSLALFILMIYLLLGAVLFWSTENWTLFQAFYFVFISMSTIGFGDFVPSQVTVLLYAFIYFLFGLALTSMCINVIQEKLSTTFRLARVTIGETFGLNPTTPITTIIEDKQDTAKQENQDAKSSKDKKPVKNSNHSLMKSDEVVKPILIKPSSLKTKS